MSGPLHLTAGQWLMAVIAAVCIGLAKSGFGGLGMITIVLMAEIMPARESTGAVLPLLICGDVLAVLAFRKHTQRSHLLVMLPPAAIGVVLGYFLMRRQIPDHLFRAVIGGIILLLVVLQCVRNANAAAFESVPHRRWFAWLIGTFAGVTTMLANAAGPIMTLFFLAVKLPKYEFVGTGAAFFLLVNLFKVPFSAQLGLINISSLTFNLVLIPAVALGIITGRKLIGLVPQRTFELIVLVFATLAAARLLLEAF